MLLNTRVISSPTSPAEGSHGAFSTPVLLLGSDIAKVSCLNKCPGSCRALAGLKWGAQVLLGSWSIRLACGRGKWSAFLSLDEASQSAAANGWKCLNTSHSYGQRGLLAHFRWRVQHRVSCCEVTPCHCPSWVARAGSHTTACWAWCCYLCPSFGMSTWQLCSCLEGKGFFQDLWPLVWTDIKMKSPREALNPSFGEEGTQSLAKHS